MVIQNALEASDDKSVTVVCIGQANNIADFLDFDEELFLRKVKRVVVMCGNFTDYDKEYLLDGVYYKGEFNVTLDIRSIQRLFEENNLPCFILDFNQGVDVLSGDGLKNQIGNPVREAYKAHGNGVNFNLPSWDLMAVMFAVGQYDNLFTVGEKGTVGIDDNGKSTFEAGIGEHRLIYRAASASEFANVINENLASE